MNNIQFPKEWIPASKVKSITKKSQKKISIDIINELFSMIVERAEEGVSFLEISYNQIVRGYGETCSTNDVLQETEDRLNVIMYRLGYVFTRNRNGWRIEW